MGVPKKCPECKKTKIGTFTMYDYPIDEDGHKDYFNGKPVICYRCLNCGSALIQDGKKWRGGAKVITFGGEGADINVSQKKEK